MRKIAVVVCLLSLAFAACGKDDDPTIDATPEATDITVTAKELPVRLYGFGNEASVVVDGLAEITIKNEGAEPHQADAAEARRRQDGRRREGVLRWASTSPGLRPFTVGGGTAVVGAGRVGHGHPSAAGGHLRLLLLRAGRPTACRTSARA